MSTMTPSLSVASLSLLPTKLIGLSEETRSNYHVMKDLGQHTRMDPDARTNTIMKFMKNLRRCVLKLIIILLP